MHSKQTISILSVHLSTAPLKVPSCVIDKVNYSSVEYQVRRNDDITNALITGYEVIRFGVTMIGEYVNAQTGRRVTISPAVPGAQCRITAWALTGSYDGRRSATPAVVDATTGEASECCRCKLSIALYIIAYPVHCTYFNITFYTIEKHSNQVSLQEGTSFTLLSYQHCLL